MGKGIDIARAENPEHAQLIDDMKDQLLLVLINRLAKKGRLVIPVSEVDATGDLLLMFSVDPKARAFNFELRKKQ